MQWSDGRRLKLRDLNILLTVIKSGSMGKAAADLAMSQPSVSKAIAESSTPWDCGFSTGARTESNQRFMAARCTSALSLYSTSCARA